MSNLLSLDSIAIPHLSPDSLTLLRKATLRDIEGIHELIGYWAAKGQMLVRSRQLLAESIRDFWVMVALSCPEDATCLDPTAAPHGLGRSRGGPLEGEEVQGIAGVCGLNLLAPDLAEVRGLAIHPSFQGKGLGKKLVAACEQEGRALGLPTLFAWTYQQQFFEACGFERMDKSKLHPKVWSECQRCAFFENCNEIAMRKTLD